MFIEKCEMEKIIGVYSLDQSDVFLNNVIQTGITVKIKHIAHHSNLKVLHSKKEEHNIVP